jgi:hypothetical protein
MKDDARAHLSDQVVEVLYFYYGRGVAEKISDRIRHLVYLDGYIPEDGKTTFDLIPGFRRSVQEKER